MKLDYVCPMCRGWTKKDDRNDLRVGVKTLVVCEKCLKKYTEVEDDRQKGS